MHCHTPVENAEEDEDVELDEEDNIPLVPFGGDYFGKYEPAEFDAAHAAYEQRSGSSTEED